MRFIRTLGLALALTSLLAASASAATTRGTAVHIGSSKLGRVLVDSRGMTLYIWAHDKGSKSTCYGDCAQYWPPVITSGKPRAAGGAKAALLGTTRRKDGRMQVTYKRHPLYGFVQDKKPGDVKGEGLTGFGGRWDPVSAAGAAVRKENVSKSASPEPLLPTALTPTPFRIAR